MLRGTTERYISILKQYNYDGERYNSRVEHNKNSLVKGERYNKNLKRYIYFLERNNKKLNRSKNCCEQDNSI